MSDLAPHQRPPEVFKDRPSAVNMRRGCAPSRFLFMRIARTITLHAVWALGNETPAVVGLGARNAALSAMPALSSLPVCIALSTFGSSSCVWNWVLTVV